MKERQEHCVYAPYVHPANWRSVADDTKGALTSWTQNFVAHHSKHPTPCWLFYPVIDPLKLRPISLDWLHTLPNRHLCTLVLDDSHALGVWGTNGEGIGKVLQNIPHISYVRVGSLSKGMGLPAGFVAGATSLLQQIRHSPFYRGASMPSAASMYVLLHGTQRVAELRQKLHQHITLFVENILQENIDKHFEYLSHYPIFNCTSGVRLHRYLKSKHYLTAYFSYPKVKDKPRTRLILNASHQKKDLEKLLETLKDFYKRNPTHT